MGAFLFSGIACAEEEKVLYLYYWANGIDDKVITQFEEETGIKVHRDYYDTEEVLESKLLSGTNLYDVVMPSASPYYVREVTLDVYQPLDKSLLPNWHLLSPMILKPLAQIDPQNKFGAPYSWGTTGFVYDKEIVKTSQSFDLQTLATILNPEKVQKYAHCGIMLLDNPQDMFEAVSVFLGYNQTSKNEERIQRFESEIQKIRPYIKAFSSNADKMINSILLGETCIAQMWSGEALRAMAVAKKTGKKLGFAVPKEHVGAWCDLFAIPKNARHPQNAHKFINFMMRTDIAAINTKATRMASANFYSKKLLPLALQKNKVLFPDHIILDKLQWSQALPLKLERKLIRLWSNIKANR